MGTGVVPVLLFSVCHWPGPGARNRTWQCCCVVRTPELLSSWHDAVGQHGSGEWEAVMVQLLVSSKSWWLPNRVLHCWCNASPQVAVVFGLRDLLPAGNPCMGVPCLVDCSVHSAWEVWISVACHGCDCSRCRKWWFVWLQVHSGMCVVSTCVSNSQRVHSEFDRLATGV